MLAKISDLFEVKTYRPLHAQDVVSIAELAQYVETETGAMYPMAQAYDRIREAFSFEIDEDNHLYYVDFKDFRAEFKDGSSLVAKLK
jgi:hypothetical protein